MFLPLQESFITSYLHVLAHYGCLNKNESHRLIYLNAWLPADGSVWKGLRGKALLEEVCHCRGGALWLQELMALPAGSLCLMVVDQNCELWGISPLYYHGL